MPKEDPLVREIADMLREWNIVWKRLYAVSTSIDTVAMTALSWGNLIGVRSIRDLKSRCVELKLGVWI